MMVIHTCDMAYTKMLTVFRRLPFPVRVIDSEAGILPGKFKISRWLKLEDIVLPVSFRRSVSWQIRHRRGIVLGR